MIAVELLQLTYLHRTQPDSPAKEILNPLEIKILKAKGLSVNKVDNRVLKILVGGRRSWLTVVNFILEQVLSPPNFPNY